MNKKINVRFIASNEAGFDECAEMTEDEIPKPGVAICLNFEEQTVAFNPKFVVSSKDTDDISVYGEILEIF